MTWHVYTNLNTTLTYHLSFQGKNIYIPAKWTVEADSCIPRYYLNFT